MAGGKQVTMKLESNMLQMKWLRGQGLWLGILLLDLGILLQGVQPLWHSALVRQEQARQLEARVDQLQRFATHWDGEAVEEEKRKLAENARKLEQPRPGKLAGRTGTDSRAVPGTVFSAGDPSREKTGAGNGRMAGGDIGRELFPAAYVFPPVGTGPSRMLDREWDPGGRWLRTKNPL
jgi:hypothetical protein